MWTLVGTLMCRVNPYLRAGRMKEAKIAKPVWMFLFLCFAFSWSIALVIKLMDGFANPLAGLFLVLFMCGPAFAALICTKLYNKGRAREVLGFNGGFNMWLVWSWLAGLALVLGALLISALPEQVQLQDPMINVKAALGAQGKALPPEVDKPWMTALIITQGFLLGPLINAPLMLSEELGWRGWLWAHLKKLGFWRASLLTGFIWGIWHAPIILMGHNYPSMPKAGAGLFVLYCILLAPIMSFVREKNSSIWAPCVLHGTLNAAAGVGLMMQSSLDMPWRGAVGIGGFVMLIVFNLIIVSRQNFVKAR